MPQLIINGIEFPVGSDRGVQQSLATIGAASQGRRTINGTYRNVSPPQFKKYTSVVTCTDMTAPKLTGVWPGKVVQVDCGAEIPYLTGEEEPDRPVAGSRVEGPFTYWRPRLTMVVVSHESNHDDWGAVVGWTLSLEEQ